MKTKIRFKLGVMPEHFVPKGALEKCFIFYPNFQIDFKFLVEKKYIKIISYEKCKWLKSKISLAEYIKRENWDTPYVPGGFWAPVEKAFGMKRHSLRKSAGKYSDSDDNDKRTESKDFGKIKNELRQYRKNKEEQSQWYYLYSYIKRIILLEADENKPETIESSVIKIINLFTGNKGDKK